MALNPNHQLRLDMTKAFESADKNTPRDKIGRASYGFGAKGLPRTPAQQASVKKAAQASAMAREVAGMQGPPPGNKGMQVPGTTGRSPVAPKSTPGVDTGGLALTKPRGKGLLSL